MKKFIALLLAVTFVFAMATSTVSAKTYDVDDWAEVANDEFELTWSENPTKNVSKGDFMFAILRMIQASRYRNDDDLLESYDELDFKDADELDNGEYVEASILVDLGVLNGYNGYMNMDDDVKRAEAAKILYYFDDEELNLDVIRKNANFGDINGHWAEAQINYAYKIGMVNGRGLNTDGSMIFDPEGNLTIQELMQIMYNIYLVADYTEEDVAYALCQTFNVETDLDIKDYDIDYDEYETKSVIYMNVDDTIEYTTDKKSYWSSSKSSIASVSNKGLIKARSEGTAVITNGNDVILTVVVGETEHYITVGDELSLSNTTSSNWASSNKKIATVDRTGTVTGIKEGTVTISRGSYESYKVTVVEESIITMNVDDTITLGNNNYKWSSSDEDIATVSSRGVITAIDSGYTKISNKYTSYYVVVLPTSEINMNVGDTIKFNSSGWKTSNSKIVSVSSTGIMKALKKGTATLTNDDATVSINVGNYSDGYTRNYTMYVGDTKTLGNGKYDSSWESENTKIATVTSYGKVTAKRVGEVVIYNDDEEYLITVIEDGDNNDEYEYTVEVGTTLMLGDGDSDSSWTSSNSKIATVSEYGMVKALKTGNVIISNDYDEYYITVVSKGNNSNNSSDDEYDYDRSIVYVNDRANVQPYFNAMVGDTLKVFVESLDGELINVTCSNSKCKITKDITNTEDDTYTFTVSAVTAGSCVITLEFENGTEIEYSIYTYKE